MKKILILLLAVVFASLLAGCGGAAETELSGEEKDAVLAYSEAKTENMMAGMKAGDYAAFSQDFDQAMLNAMTQEAFGKFKQDYDGKLGAYVSQQGEPGDAEPEREIRGRRLRCRLREGRCRQHAGGVPGRRSAPDQRAVVQQVGILSPAAWEG